MNRDLADRLLALKARDAEVRKDLLDRGLLFEGYAPEMEEVHVQNAGILEDVIDQHGWPGIGFVGSDAADAAWLVAQHAISLPRFQRRCLRLLRDAVTRGDAPARQEAFLTDRIRFNERRHQVYSTIFDWDEDGVLSPWTIEAPDGVDERRTRVNLPPLVDTIREHRQRAAGETPLTPQGYDARQREILAWCERVGWLEEREEDSE